MKKQFIRAEAEYSTTEKSIPAPFLRRGFNLPFQPKQASIKVCGLGFYQLFVNGREITKGYLAPYISNPDHYCYYDEYDLLPYLKKGKNAIGLILGNGMMNAVGGRIWDFDKAPWRGAPCVALELNAGAGNQQVSIFADPSFRTAPSPTRFDDLRYGEYYDARCEINGWNLPDFDDSNWNSALIAPAPRGELRKCQAEPIRILRTVRPERIMQSENGYIYDFGINSAGICKLRIQRMANVFHSR